MGFGKRENMKKVLDNNYDIEILVSTMNRADASFIKKMNIKSDVVVGNQTNCESVDVYNYDGNAIKMVSTKTRGLSNNRNITLSNASGKVCLLADDDLVYEDDYLETIKNSFMENPDADLIIFNLHENPITRFIIKKRMKINRLNYMRFGSVRIAFKLNSIRKKNISFDPNFGTGANVSFGEDTIFLHDCLKAHLKIIALPKTILSLTNQRESTWFRGFDDKYFNDKGKLFYRINKKAHLFLCLQDSIRHKKEYQLPWKKVFALELKGK